MALSPTLGSPLSHPCWPTSHKSWAFDLGCPATSPLVFGSLSASHLQGLKLGSGEYNLARTTKLVLATYWHQYSAILFLTVTVPEMGVQCPGPSLGLPTLRLGFRRREEEQAIPNYRFLFHPMISLQTLTLPTPLLTIATIIVIVTVDSGQ